MDGYSLDWGSLPLFFAMMNVNELLEPNSLPILIVSFHFLVSPFRILGLFKSGTDRLHCAVCCLIKSKMMGGTWTPESHVAINCLLFTGQKSLVLSTQSEITLKWRMAGSSRLVCLVEYCCVVFPS